VGQGADAPDDPNAQNAGCLLVAVGLSFLHKVAESQMSQQLTHSPGIGFTSQHMHGTLIPSVASTPKCSFFRNRSNIWY